MSFDLACCGGKLIGFNGYSFIGGKDLRKAFTLIELLVVFAVISILMGILVPSLGKAKHHGRTIIGANNQRQIVTAANLFAFDNDDGYPPSVSYIAYNGNWNWNDPRTLTSWNTTPSHAHRAMSEYLGGYIEETGIMFCPKAPKKNKHLQQAWDAGDDWNNPDTPFDIRAMRGTYCFYWNYVGWVDEYTLFRGPRRSSGGNGQSGLVMSCYFGYGHRRTFRSYGSCEKLKSAEIVAETFIESTWWARERSSGYNSNTINVKLYAGYTDGHVESFGPSEAVPMKAIMNRRTFEPYPNGVGPGDFYVPANALR